MLAHRDTVANLAVRDLAAAKAFYQDTLGLRLVDAEGEEVAVFQSGATRINVYRSDYAGSNRATALTWPVEDVDAVVCWLKDKGVAFEHYDMPGTHEGDVHVFGVMRVAWFKDPDGNILNLINC